MKFAYFSELLNMFRFTPPISPIDWKQRPVFLDLGNPYKNGAAVWEDP